jgi:hypothetical protein
MVFVPFLVFAALIGLDVKTTAILCASAVLLRLYYRRRAPF